MNLITHALAGWSIGARFSRNPKEISFIALSSVVPDLDGAGAIVDLINGSEAIWFSEYHHRYGHSLLFSLFLVLVVFVVSKRNLRLTGWCGAVFYLHLFCDLIGARGPDGYQWPIFFFYPFLPHGLVWSGQWEINAWPNILITVVLILDFFLQTLRLGFSPIGLLSKKADAALLMTLKKRFYDTGRSEIHS
jgi:hypothetical protein